MRSPRRTDAERNRETILRVAEAAFSQGSEIIPLAEIARRARLGRATVYRHFPDRQALGLAVAARQLAAFKRIVNQDDARGSFRELLAAVLFEQISWRPLVRLFRELPVRYQQQYADTLVTVLTPAFRRAQADGRLREDVEPTDLLLVFEMVEAAIVTGTARAHPGDPTRRVVAVILDGFLAERAA
ncbi:TetR/AcrR family transcriptional regulator [Amycolatopsis sp. lyj-112]|uniref:TetR/AcrR family transcriptional regulator n=1 Tax=Amycolatopsis sp. lyj-112 TaxID=2789288 RepID=UPI00397C4AF8